MVCDRRRRHRGHRRLDVLRRRARCRSTNSRSAFGTAMFALAVFFFGYVLFFAGLDAAERKRVGVIVIFFLCAAMFWAGFEQQATTVQPVRRRLHRSLGARRLVPRRRASRLVVPVGQSAVHHPVRAVLRVDLGVRSARATSILPRRRRWDSGLVLLGVGFLVMMWAAELVVSSGGKVGAHLAAADLPVPHLRRVVPVARGPVQRHQARAAEIRGTDDGHLVPRAPRSATHRRPDRRPRRLVGRPPTCPASSC